MIYNENKVSFKKAKSGIKILFLKTFAPAYGIVKFINVTFVSNYVLSKTSNAMYCFYKQ